MIRTAWFRGMLLAGLVTLLAAPAEAGTVVLSADADIWMSSLYNRQEDDGISVWQSGDREGAVDFNLAGVTQPIVGAHVELYAPTSGNNTGPITQQAYLLDPPGTAALSWSTLPGRTQIALDSLGSYALGSVPMDTWYSSADASAADVAKLEAIRTGSGSLTFLFKASAGKRDWDDKAGWSGDNPPRLVLVTESSWNVASGDWNTDSNWDPVGVPTSGDVINIANGGTANAGTNLVLGDGSGESGLLRVSNGTLNTAGYIQLGNHGKGTLLQTGGVVNGNGSGAVALDLGGYSDGEGVYQMDGGQLNVPSKDVWVGEWGKGAFIQNQGDVTLGTNLVLGVGQEPGQPRSNGRYEILDGTLTLNSTTGYLEVGNVGDGTFVQGGGSVTLNRTTSGTTAALYVGSTATGVGTYQMQDGQLNLPSGRLSVGDNGNGTFLQTGGDVLIGTPGSDALSLGFRPGSSGTYDIRGGSLTVNSRPVWIADGGNGTFLQSGGAVTLSYNSGSATALGLAYSAGTHGTYQVSGGALSVPNGNVEVGHNGVGQFDVIGSGGTINLRSYSQNGSSTLGAAIDNGGLSAINLSVGGTAATFASGAMLDMDIEGGVALTTTKSFDIMRAAAGTISGTPAQTDTEPGLPYTVTNSGTVLNAAWSGAGYGPVTAGYAVPTEIVIGGGGAASGYLTIDGIVLGRDLVVALDVQDNAGPLSLAELDALADSMRSAGVSVYTSHGNLKPPYDLLLSFRPAAATSYFAWDLTDYDAAHSGVDGLVLTGLMVGVPEPSSLLLLALGALALVFCRRRK